MAALKENVSPATCTTTIKQLKKNKLKTPKRNNDGAPFKPKEDNQIIEIKEGQDVIEIKENKEHQKTEDQDYEVVTESGAVLDILNVNKLPSGMEQSAARLDDHDYVSTRPKRKLDHDDSEEPKPKKKLTLFLKVHNLLIEEIDQVTNITTCNQDHNKWITVNFK